MLPRLCLPVGVTHEDYAAAAIALAQIKKDLVLDNEKKKSDIDKELAGSLAYHEDPVDETQCAICFDSILRGVGDEFLGDFMSAKDDLEGSKLRLETERLTCGHIFHVNCISEHVMRDGKACPSCRKVLSDEDLASLENARGLEALRKTRSPPDDDSDLMWLLDLMPPTVRRENNPDPFVFPQ